MQSAFMYNPGPTFWFSVFIWLNRLLFKVSEIAVVSIQWIITNFFFPKWKNGGSNSGKLQVRQKNGRGGFCEFSDREFYVKNLQFQTFMPVLLW